jgi:hypothetical protein
VVFGCFQLVLLSYGIGMNTGIIRFELIYILLYALLATLFLYVVFFSACFLAHRVDDVRCLESYDVIGTFSLLPLFSIVLPLFQ